MRQPSYFETVAASYDDDMGYAEFAAMCDDTDFPEEEPVWTDEDEAGLDAWEETRRERLAEANEY